MNYSKQMNQQMSKTMRHANMAAGAKHTKRLSNRRTDPMLAQHIGERFRIARELNGLSGIETARLLGYANSTQISQIEKGERPIPGSWAFIVKVAQAFGVSSDYLLGLSPHLERDPAIAQQFATMRSFKNLFEEHAATMTSALVQHCIRSDYSYMDVRDFCNQVRALITALRVMIEINPDIDFEGDVRGGAKIFAIIEALETLHLPLAESFAKRKLANEMHLKQLAVGETGPIAYLLEEHQQSLEF